MTVIQERDAEIGVMKKQQQSNLSKAEVKGCDLSLSRVSRRGKVLGD